MLKQNFKNVSGIANPPGFRGPRAKPPQSGTGRPGPVSPRLSAYFPRAHISAK